MKEELVPITGQAIKTLFIIDEYRIWAYTYGEALRYYEIIKRL